MCLYTPETAEYQIGIVEKMADVGGAVLEDINQQEEQDKESEISAQENNAPYGDGGPDDGSDGDDEDTSDSNEDYSVSFP